MVEMAKPRSFSRRSFIAGAAALTAAGALAGCSQGEGGSPEPAPGAETEIFVGSCRGNCSGGCLLDVHVRDGQVVRTTAHKLPEAEYNRICPRGLTHVERIYSSKRLQYPMRRIGERGAGEFERITWDEAIDEICTKWKGYADEFGPASIGHMSQSGNQGVTGAGMNSYRNYFRNVMGVSSISMNFDMAHIMAFMRAAGYGTYCTGSEPKDLVNSKTIICWGSNPAVSLPQLMHFIYDARDNGGRYIVIDPVYTPNAAKADWYIPINPATDGALALGLLKQIVDKGWQDEAFLKASTECVFLVKEEDGMYLRLSDTGVEVEEGGANPALVWDEAAGAAVPFSEAASPALTGVPAVDGVAVRTVYDIVVESVQPYTLERTSEITGVPAADIEELARIYHEDGPVYTLSMFGADHYSNGLYNYWDMYALIFFSGQVGKSGAGGMYTSIWPSHLCDKAALSPTDAAGNPCQGPGPDIPSNYVQEILDTGMNVDAPFPLKSVFIQYTNPMSVNVDRNYMEKWLKQIDFVVVADMNMTETALYADILLPVCHWFEQVEAFDSYGQAPYMYWQDKAVEPLYESKPDFEIDNLLMAGMGYGEFTCESVEAFVKARLKADAAAELGFSFDSLKEEKAVRIFPDTYVNLSSGVFPTATGRACLYQESPRPGYNTGQEVDLSKERTLYWEPALEADAGSEARKKHPFHVISEHLRTRTHSQWWEAESLREVEPRPCIKINPQDAAELGLAEGDSARMFNDRGSVVLEVAINPGYPRKVVGVPRGYQADEFIEGHFGSLSTRVYNQAVANSICNDCAVSIEKA